MALGSSPNGAESWFEHKKCEANKARLETSLKAFESKLYNP